MSPPSILRSAGTLPPASFTNVGSKSIFARHGVADAAGGDRARATRRSSARACPLPRCVPLPPRSGPAMPPFLPCVSQGPLSLVKMTSVLRVELAVSRACRARGRRSNPPPRPSRHSCRWPTCPGMSRPDGAAHARPCAASTGKTARPCWRVMNFDRLVGIARGQRVLVFGLSVSITVSSRTSGSGGCACAAARPRRRPIRRPCRWNRAGRGNDRSRDGSGRNSGWSPDVPLADGHRRVARCLSKLGDRCSLALEPDRAGGKDHVGQRDALGVAAGHHLGPRRRADRRSSRSSSASSPRRAIRSRFGVRFISSADKRARCRHSPCRRSG